MGIASSSSSSTESNTRNSQVPPGKPSKLPESLKAAVRKLDSDLDAMFPHGLGESSTEEEREKASEARKLEFMRAGGCAQAFTAVSDCVEEPGPRTVKFLELAYKLNNCMYTHHHYYQPVLEVLKPVEEEFFKEFEKP